MLKKFWEQKKHIINITAIFIAIGAIFLTIPLPENKEAQDALMNLQLFWLIVISIMILILMVLLYSFFIKIEDNLERKKFDSSGAISLIVFMSALWLMQNLWKYIFVLYKDQYVKFISQIVISFHMLYFGILIYVSDKLIKYYTKAKKKFFIYFFAVVIFSSIIFSLVISTIDLKFNMNDWFDVAIIYLVISIILIFCRCEYMLRKHNKKAINIS